MKRHQSGSIAIAFLIVLAVSLLANLALWHEVTVEHDAKVAVEAKLGEANKQTKACNDSIGQLETAAFERGQQAEKDRTAAAERNKKHASRADRELATPATTPGNECKSAKDRISRWLGERKP
jgi:hypothetical protein